ncbi:MAG: nucleoside phosphorylase [Candidatus Microthrix parvicella]|jgi:uridine phosphorylase|uniref:Putative purine-nucleoside phosphorylase n=1 Tax=Candidatus Neomicrothrix parvicella RN1 TaxID=1229780 RepID=R4YX11_9ACTN|nr:MULTISPECIES: nucleoside phosphorylase [Microthrix]NLH68530.1 nucleoside phosphorylase [Candidatus Microthrix parvicella]CCM62668.1 putative purine-nucleoside phosphorylase [Candidatus Microthrix parvicella RN1]
MVPSPAPEPKVHSASDRPTPLLRAKRYDAPSVFEPANLLREGRRQLGRADVPVPAVCLLDPDGDIVRHLCGLDLAVEHPGWACYHTTLWTFDLDGTRVGVIGCAVGASFAVLLAEQLFASGCELLLSVTSSGMITSLGDPPYLVIINRALRDLGTSLHYLPPGDWSAAPGRLLDLVDGRLGGLVQRVVTGSTWTTDAPYRETEAAIAEAEALGIAAVEMEAAALYAFATARHRDVLCLAHVTNSMATGGDDFEKGEDGGAPDALALVAAVIAAVR